MYDNKALNGRRTGTPLGAREASRGGHAPAVRPSEAELLRVIEKALEEQRQARARAEAPLTSRIEAILAPQFAPANDAPSQPVKAEKPPVQPAAIPQLPEPVFVPANTNDIPAAVDDEPLHLPVKPIAFALVGLMLGAAFPLMMPQAPVRYSAATVLHVGGDTATRPALTQAAAKKLVSAPMIAAAVASLKLDRDPEFAGEKPNAVGIALDLLSGNGAAADAASRAEASLAAAVEVVPDGGTGLVRLNVSTASAEKSRQIAARLSGMLLASLAGSAAGSDSTLKKAYEQARAELDAFTAKTGEGNVKVAIDLQQRINQLDADLKVAEQRITLSKERADRLKAAKPADVVDGVLPTDMMSPVLLEARDRYAAEKATLAQLSIDLGPRHPKLLAQQGIVDGLRDKLSRELSVQAKDAAVDAKSAVDARRKLSDERNGLIAQSRDTGVDLAKLTELRDKADAAKSRLDTTLPQAGMGDGNISMQAAPQVFAIATGYSTPLRSAIGGGIGLIIGLAASMLSSLFRKRQEDPLDLLDIPVIVEPPAVQQPEPEPEPEQPDDLTALRAELAELRSRFQSYAATGR
jgi:uncharacterized protein involved in exopolysaccharide biosynthesis